MLRRPPPHTAYRPSLRLLSRLYRPHIASYYALRNYGSPRATVIAIVIAALRQIWADVALLDPTSWYVRRSTVGLSADKDLTLSMRRGEAARLAFQRTRTKTYLAQRWS